MKKFSKLFLSVLATLALASCDNNSSEPATSVEKKEHLELPEPFDSSKEGAATFDIKASNITSANLADYAGRDDIRYIDLRDISDYSKSRLEGFEDVEFFAKIYDKSADHSGTQLFFKDANGVFQPRYAESVDMLKELLPQNETLFLMCQSGGRVAICMQIMEQFGWDMSKVYNVGGMGQYGESALKVDFSIDNLTKLTTPDYGTKATSSKKYVADLPAPFDSAKEGAAAFDIKASNIDSSNLKQYYNREDVRYIDLRDGSDYSNSRLERFEDVEFFAKIYDKTGDGSQLFYKDGDKYVARYEESVDILKDVLPQDQTLFLMCQSGGRVAMCMQIMEQFGWDMTNVYNVGGMGQYTQSEYKVDAKLENLNATTNTVLKGSFTEQASGYDYTMVAYVTVNDQKKIVSVVTLGGFTSASYWPNATGWLEGSKALLASLAGKDLDGVSALLGADDKLVDGTAVAGATLSSRRAIKAVIDALTEKKEAE